MKLFYSPGTSSLLPHIALSESGLAFEAIRVDEHTKVMDNGGDYRTINPLGYVPALQLDDDTILTEAVSIVQYIADKVPAKRLAPPNGTLVPSGTSVFPCLSVESPLLRWRALLAPFPLSTQTGSLTLPQALQKALTANARLAVAECEVGMAEGRRQAGRRPSQLVGLFRGRQRLRHRQVRRDDAKHRASLWVWA